MAASASRSAASRSASGSVIASTAESTTAPSFTRRPSSPGRLCPSSAPRRATPAATSAPLRLVGFSGSGEELEVPLGAMDAPDPFVPTYELWTVRRESWLPPFPGTRLHERDGDDGD